VLGIHASRFDVDNRDVEQDARLSLNSAWYTDILMVMTDRWAPVLADVAIESVVAQATV